MLFKVLNIEGLFQMEYQKEQSNRLHKPLRHKVRTKKHSSWQFAIDFQ